MALYLISLLQMQKVCYLTVLPSIVCFGIVNMTSTVDWSRNVTNPNPLDFPVWGLVITMQSVTSPYWAKYACSASVMDKIQLFSITNLRNIVIWKYEMECCNFSNCIFHILWTDHNERRIFPFTNICKDVKYI